jgi:hypothetical protein
MDHVVYVDAKAGEMEKLLNGSKTMMIRGAAGRKLPYGRVSVGDVLYLINNNAEGVAKAKGVVSKVIDNESEFNGEKMDKEQSTALVEEYRGEGQLHLTDKQFKRWVGKRYVVIIEVNDIEEVEPFEIDKSNYGNMDDWLPVEDVESVRK